MRLLYMDESRKICLTQFDRDIPPYAILSHTWRPDGGEVLFQDIANGSARDKPGYSKVAFCAETAASHGFKYFWIDTCAIDKSSSAELQESINSMFAWYRDAQRCYVYLSDVSVEDYDLRSHSSQRSLEAAFSRSRWFTRGWTLQELIAPSSVEFYSQEGKRLGDKMSLERQIHEITSIPIPALRGAPLSQFDVEARFRWSKGRQTTKEEDWVYSLLGIFDVCIPLLYGEGRKKAITRLLREIHLGARGFSQDPVREVQSIDNQGALILLEGSNIQNTTKRLHAYSEELMTAQAGHTRRNLEHEGAKDVLDTTGATNSTAKAQLTPQADERGERVLNKFGSFSEWASSFSSGRTKAEEDEEDQNLEAFMARKKNSKGGFVNRNSGSTPDKELGVPKVERGIPTDLGHSAIPAITSASQKIQHSLSEERHIIVTGLKKGSDTTTFAEEIIVTKPKSILRLLKELKGKGYTNLAGFRHLTTQRLIWPFTNDEFMPVDITDGPSCYDLRLGLRINENERLIDYYNNLLLDEIPGGLSMKDHGLEVLHKSESLEINTRRLGRTDLFSLKFMRTLRIPDDGKSYPLASHFGPLPLYDVTRSSKPLPPKIKDKGGAIIPLYQREALSLVFQARQSVYSPMMEGGQEEMFAVRAFAGSINCLTGLSATRVHDEQDYVVVPRNCQLDGFKTGNGEVRQFVAMPLGFGYSVEKQVTGREDFGGLQFQIAPRKLTCVDFYATIESSAGHTVKAVGERLDLSKTPKELQLPKPIIWMKEHTQNSRIKENRVEMLREAWDARDEDQEIFPTFSDEPKTYDSCRMTFVDEAYGSLYSKGRPRSESLVLQAVEDIGILIEWSAFGIEKEPSVEKFSPFMHMSTFKRKLVAILQKARCGKIPYGVILINGVAHRGYPRHYSPIVENDLSDATLSFRAEERPDEDIRLGGFPHGTQDGRTDGKPGLRDGWEMALGAGGKLQQHIQKTVDPGLWDWKASCFINIQIMNSIAFRDLTGISPVCPLSFREYRLAKLPFFDITSPEGFIEMDSSIAYVKSISQIDSTKDITLGVRVRKDLSPVLCVMCERGLCDTLLTCGHIFCSQCIKLDMTREEGYTDCAFCQKQSLNNKQFSAYMEILTEENREAQNQSVVAKATDILPLLTEADRGLEPLEQVLMDLQYCMRRVGHSMPRAKVEMTMAHLAKMETSDKIAFVKALLYSEDALALPGLVSNTLALAPNLSDFEIKDVESALGIIAKRGFRYSYDVVLHWMFSGPHPVSTTQISFKSLMRDATLLSSVEQILKYLHEQDTSAAQIGITLDDAYQSGPGWNLAKLKLLVAAGCNINAAESASLLLARNTPQAVENLLKAGARTDTQHREG